MKRWGYIVVAALLCLLLPVASLAAPAAAKVTISYSAKIVSNDHVGKNWSTYIEVGETTIRKGKSAKVAAADTLKIVCTAIEKDKYPDVGSATIEINLKDLKKGKNTFKQTVTVTEDRGRYAGNQAKWSFTVTVKK